MINQYVEGKFLKDKCGIGMIIDIIQDPTVTNGVRTFSTLFRLFSVNSRMQMSEQSTVISDVIKATNSVFRRHA